MCGIAGFVGITDPIQRLAFVTSAGVGIDSRGGDASGYLSVDRKTGRLFHAKRVGTWLDSKRKFQKRVASGDMAMMHARWATCGDKKAQDQAHPFEIKREGRTKLFGMHNGCIWNAKESATANGRRFSVDSCELFELMADGDVEGIQDLDGYGVITWFVPGTNYVNMVRLSSHSEIVVVSLKTGGIAWASTWEILQDALEFAELEADYDFQVPDVGRIYQFRDGGVYKTQVDGIQFESRMPEEAPESWESALIAQWEKEQEEKDKLEEAYLDMLRNSNQDDPFEEPEKAPMFDAALRTSWERDQDEYEDRHPEYPSIAAMYR